MVLDEIYEYTSNYSKIANKVTRKKIGQFFTSKEIAKYMANMISLDKTEINILDAGAGSGILTVALFDKIVSESHVKKIHIDAYENDNEIISLLKIAFKKIEEVAKTHKKEFSYRIIPYNFILHNQTYWQDDNYKGEYDIVISNPPYKKIRKVDPEAQAMKNIVYGQPNLYFLFMALGAKMLRQGGELICITPRSFTSGAYFKKFRSWFLDNMYFTHIHTFKTRNDNFKDVLQEVIISKSIKGQEHPRIKISNSDNKFGNVDELILEKKYIVTTCSERYILLPTTQQEVKVIDAINRFKYTLPELGYKFSTGQVVDFRATEFITGKPNNDTVPLIWPCNIVNNMVCHPTATNKMQYIIDKDKSRKLLIPNVNYIIVKRFTSKEEKRRIQPAIYLKEDSDFNTVGIENHLNCLAKKQGTMTERELLGLFVMFNSTLIDRYYRLVNGSTQVNATEIKSIPFPSIEQIMKLGDRLLEENIFTTEMCDSIINKILGNNMI